MIVIYLPIFTIKEHKVLENTEIWGMNHDEFNKIINKNIFAPSLIQYLMIVSGHTFQLFFHRLKKGASNFR